MCHYRDCQVSYIRSLPYYLLIGGMAQGLPRWRKQRISEQLLRPHSSAVEFSITLTSVLFHHLSVLVCVDVYVCEYVQYIHTCTQQFINPQHACAARVTVVCRPHSCVSVCVSVSIAQFYAKTKTRKGIGIGFSWF